MLGTRGVPANHGGFETAAEHIGTDLLSRGWRVVVYCQTPGESTEVRYDTWRGIERVHLPERFPGPLGTIWFDALAVRHASRFHDVCLTFGYNTAFLNELLRARHVPTVINMDGVEWQRARWSSWQKRFLRVNERIAGRLGDALIADHPVIARHLETVAPASKITTITYGAPTVRDADPAPVRSFGVEPGRYLLVVARPVPENSLHEIVAQFSRRPRGVKLVVLGSYSPDEAYQRSVLDAASDEVCFVGPQYDEHVVSSLRHHALAYVHGHTVGGTNPSLVEALGAGTPVIAHDNPYNRWVAGDAARFFGDALELENALLTVLGSPSTLATMRRNAYARHAEEFTWRRVVDKYESLLLAHLPEPRREPWTAPVEIPRQRSGREPARIRIPLQREQRPAPAEDRPADDRPISPA